MSRHPRWSRPARRTTHRRLFLEPLETRQLLSASSFDTTFGGAGFVFTPGGDSASASAVVEQSDGKLLVAGTLTGATYSDLAVVRYNANGSLDTTFGTGGIAIVNNAPEDDSPPSLDHGNAVAIQSDGKIIVGGDYNFLGAGQPQFLLVRFDTDGTVDTTFGGHGLETMTPGGGTPAGGASIKGVAIGFDDEIFAVGVSNHEFTYVTFSASGAVGTTKMFDAGGGGDSQASAIISDGRDGMLIGGYGLNSATGKKDFFLISENSFSFSAALTDLEPDVVIDALVLDSNGRLVAAGSSEGHAVVERFVLSAATLDTTFGSGGIVTLPSLGTTDVATALAIQDGEIVYAGSTTTGATSQMLVGRLNFDGTVDASFNGGSPLEFDPGGSSSSAANAMIVDRTGRLVLTGSATVSGLTELATVRLGTTYTTNGTTLIIDGTAGDDNLNVIFTSATTYTVTLNGVATNYTTTSGANQATKLVFHGGAGNDTIVVSDTYNTRTAVLAGTSLSFFGQNFDLESDGVENNHVYGTSGDTATISGIQVKDAVAGDPKLAWTSVITQYYSYLHGTPQHAFFDQAIGFGSVQVSAAGGSQATAFIYTANNAPHGMDSGAIVTADSQRVVLQSAQGSLVASGFTSTYSQSSGNVGDRFYANGDSLASNTFVGTTTYSYLKIEEIGVAVFGQAEPSPILFHEAIGFHYVVATSKNNGIAHFYASLDDDTYVATPSYAYMHGGFASSEFFNEAIGFLTTNAYASGAFDRAYIYGQSTNGNAQATLAGGLETAPGDSFYSRAGYSYMTGSVSAGITTVIYTNLVSGFLQVVATAQHNGTAYLYDAPGNNDFFASGSTGQLTRDSDSTGVLVTNFAAVNAFATDGNTDHQHVQAHDYALSLLGNWT